jgi:16S rRNA (guanine966-N2)-methyltransferase
VRETLFNWFASVALQQSGQDPIRGARLLDAYAGTGALGIEALSRGAACVDFVELDATLARTLEAVLREFGLSDRARVLRGDVLSHTALAEHYDGVFLDPPFATHSHERALQQLGVRLSEQAWLYCESPRERPYVAALPWQRMKHGQAGAVDYALWRRTV